jgi:hypothetical protein
MREGKIEKLKPDTIKYFEVLFANIVDIMKTRNYHQIPPPPFMTYSSDKKSESDISVGKELISGGGRSVIDERKLFPDRDDRRDDIDIDNESLLESRSGGEPDIEEGRDGFHQPHYLYAPNLVPEHYSTLNPEAKADIDTFDKKVKDHNEFLRNIGTEQIRGGLISEWEDEWKVRGVQNYASIQLFVEEKLKKNREELAKLQVTEELKKLGITDPAKINKYFELMLEKKYSISDLNTNIKDLQK